MRGAGEHIHIKDKENEGGRMAEAPVHVRNSLSGALREIQEHKTQVHGEGRGMTERGQEGRLTDNRPQLCVSAPVPSGHGRRRMTKSRNQA